MALIVLLVPYPQSGNQGTDPDSGGAKVVDFVDFQHRVDFAGMGEDVRYLVGVTASSPQPKELSWIKSRLSWVLTKLAAA